jgi:hypothetical protein
MLTLKFLILTVIFWYAGNCILRLFFAMIQPDAMLDRVFGYRKLLDRLYGAENKYLRSLGDALGNCQLCISFWFMPLWFICYWIFTRISLDWFITDKAESIAGKIFIGLIWYMAFHAIGAITGLAGLLRMKLMKDKNTKDAV